MEPFTLAALAAGAYFVLRRKKTARGSAVRIQVAADCSSWDIPDAWYPSVAAPRYVSLLPAYPETMPLETRTSRITESILIGQTGSCAAKDLPNLPGAMRGLFDHIAEYVREGLQEGGNPFLPGLARYVVASETFRQIACIVVRRYDVGPTVERYAWATGKWGVSMAAIMQKLAQLDADTDDQIDPLLSDLGYVESPEQGLTKARERALLGPAVSASPESAGMHLFR
jgi:hypothetical protein